MDKIKIKKSALSFACACVKKTFFQSFFFSKSNIKCTALKVEYNNAPYTLSFGISVYQSVSSVPSGSQEALTAVGTS